MADDGQRENQIIKLPENGVTIWKPHRALPVLGAATALWVGRRVLRSILSERRTLPIHRPEKESQLQPYDEKPNSGGYIVTYTYQARWTVHVQPEDES